MRILLFGKIRQEVVRESEERVMRIESNTLKNLLLGTGFVLLGVLMLSLTQGKTDLSRDHQLIYLMGLFILLAGTATILLNERVVILVYPERGSLTVRTSSLRGSEVRVIPFAAIRSVDVVKLGQTHKGTRSYHLNIALKTGEKILTRRNSRDGDEINELARELSGLIGCKTDEAPAPQPIELGQILVSLSGAILVYVAWYRFTVGPWCRAMWFGTAPPVVMLLTFTAIMLVVRRRS